MTKKERREFDRALEDFDHAFTRLDMTLDVVLALGTSGAMMHEDDEDDEDFDDAMFH